MDPTFEVLESKRGPSSVDGRQDAENSVVEGVFHIGALSKEGSTGLKKRKRPTGTLFDGVKKVGEKLSSFR